MVRRGYYRRQLERWFAVFPREQIHVVVFERFVAEGQAVVDETCRFLGLDDPIDLAAVESHRNAAAAPLHLGLRLAYNRVAAPLARKSYRRHLPFMPGYRPGTHGRASVSGVEARIAELWERVRPKRRYPPMDPATRQRLGRLYRDENAGLGDLVGADLSRWWDSES